MKTEDVSACRKKVYSLGDVKTLLDIKVVLQSKKWFLIGGTLLGAVRKKRLLPHRSCLNIAILDKDKSAVDLIRSIGFIADDRKFKYGHLAVAKREDAYLEVYIFEEVSDGVIVQRVDPKCSPYHVYYAKLPKKFFDELSVVTLDGQEFPAPNYPEELLTLTYGNWQIKNPAHCSVKAFEKYIIE